VISHWIAATLSGIALGLAWFGCVRVRMHVGPILRERYGDHQRWAFWALTIVIMIVMANVALLILRRYLYLSSPPDNRLVLEGWFAVVALAVAFSLVFRRNSR